VVITDVQNTAVGDQALINNTGSFNTATGFGSLRSNTTGLRNTAVGQGALDANTIGLINTAFGADALGSNTTGSFNNAFGGFALGNNVSGGGNNAFGDLALFSFTAGDFNTAVGSQAGQNLTTGSRNIFVGRHAGTNVTTGNDNIYIANTGPTAALPESDTIRIGQQGTQTATFIAGFSDTVITGRPVVVTPFGQLGVQLSSARFKEAIKSMEKASESILSLRPVTFHYKTDTKGTPQFGLIAEEVAKVNPGLVLPDKEGKPYTVRYDAVNAMLLNEFLKEHRTVQEQQKEIDVLRAELKEQRALIQKVSNKIELERPATKTVLNTR